MKYTLQLIRCTLFFMHALYYKKVIYKIKNVRVIRQQIFLSDSFIIINRYINNIFYIQKGKVKMENNQLLKERVVLLSTGNKKVEHGIVDIRDMINLLISATSNEENKSMHSMLDLISKKVQDLIVIENKEVKGNLDYVMDVIENMSKEPVKQKRQRNPRKTKEAGVIKEIKEVKKDSLKSDLKNKVDKIDKVDKTPVIEVVNK